MATTQRLSQHEVKTVSLTSVAAMTATVLLAWAGWSSYSNTYNMVAMLCLVAAFVGLIIWIGAFVALLMDRTDQEVEVLAGVFAGGYVLVGLLLVHPLLGVAEFYNQTDSQGAVWAIQQFWSTIGMLDLCLIAASIVAAGIVSVVMAAKINLPAAVSSLGTGALFIVVVAVVLVAWAFLLAFAAMVVLGGIAMLSRAVQGR